jgi:molecular chaperone GrpE
MMGKRKKEEAKSSDEQMEEKNNLDPNDSDTIATEMETEQTETSGASAQYAELNDKYLRLYSDFDNYRRRTLKEKIELSQSASSDLIIKLLPILDDFDRAIKAFDITSEGDQALKDGTILIYNKFYAILTQQGLAQMRTLGESFDTDFHEAITNFPAPTPQQKGKIVDELEKGYLLHGKVIRYAKVVVGS